ncbi:sugar transporter [Dactylonectria macrodidyma]|uniref:Sugar transporter n=1 Tax=Dactylonectria macrodidyma TaxID=307937 RepID=A0A9P9IID2_9HYPO|nr:sugar transporter [Dactylonectria macrodidyma]
MALSVSEKPAVETSATATASSHQMPSLLKLSFSLVSMVMFGSAVGYDGSMSGGLLALSQWTGFMDNPAGSWLGFINAIYWVAFGIGIPVAGWAANRYGRKFTVYMSFIPLIIGTVLETAAPSPAVWIVGRTFLGFPSAIFGNVVPLIVAECAYPSQRGVLTSLYFTGFYIGATVAAWATFGVRNFLDSWSWRTICVLQLLCPLLGLPGLFLCPESPRWLVSKGRTEEARTMLINTHGGGTYDQVVEEEMTEIETALAQEALVEGGGYSQMFSTKPNLHRTAITLTLGIFSQWIGNGVVSYYLPLILNTAGVTSVTDQTLISGCLQIWNWIFAVAGASAVERFGRRKLFLLSFVIMFLSYIVITSCSGSFAETGTKAVGTAVVPSYLFTLRATISQFIFNTFVNPIALEAIGWKYYIAFAVLLLVYGIIVFFIFPETRGYSLEQITLIFEGETPEQVNSKRDLDGKVQATDNKE